MNREFPPFNPAIELRELTGEEKAAIVKLASSRTAAAREVERARIILIASKGKRAPAIARELELTEITVRSWLKRFNDVLMFSLQHPHWEFVFQPKYAAYLDLIEPWWKTLRSLALQGRRFEPWVEVEQAIEAARAV